LGKEKEIKKKSRSSKKSDVTSSSILHKLSNYYKVLTKYTTLQHCILYPIPNGSCSVEIASALIL
jgi:hypothetical protein